MLLLYWLNIKMAISATLALDLIYHGNPEKPGIIMGLFFSSTNKLFCKGQKRQAMKRKATLDIKKAVSSKKATVEDLKGKINQFEPASF